LVARKRRDPAAGENGEYLYAYVANSPENLIDPEGLSSKDNGFNKYTDARDLSRILLSQIE